MDKIIKHILFLFLSFTWGIIQSIIGSAVTLALLITGHKPKMFRYCWCFEVGTNWGGCSLGPCILVCKNSSTNTLNHEFGHSIQNILLGPLFLILIAIPSSLRYQYRKAYFSGNRDIFEAVLVSAITLLTFINITALFYIHLVYLIISTAVCIYFFTLIYWTVYVEGIKYKRNNYPNYDSIWFEGWATSIGNNIKI